MHLAQSRYNKVDCFSDHPGLENVIQIEKFQEKAYMEFQDYVTKVYPDDTYRYVNLCNHLLDLSFLFLFFIASMTLICKVLQF